MNAQEPQPHAQQQPQPPTQQPPRKRRRIFMWVFLAINALFLIWVITGATTHESCGGKTGDALTTCQAGEVGTTIGVALIVFFWLATDVILALVYLVYRLTRRRP